MVASPALRDLLASPDGKLLRERIPYKITATIADRGLMGPHELAYYAGSDILKQRMSEVSDRGEVLRVNGFVDKQQEKLDPVLALLIVIIFVVLLMPVGVFIAAAVRFGGDRRDRRLAALRLAGADRRMTRWIAAGEALAGAVVGVVVGSLFFVIGRQYVGEVSIAGLNVFPSDLDPSPLLAVGVALAVPAVGRRGDPVRDALGGRRTPGRGAHLGAAPAAHVVAGAAAARRTRPARSADGPRPRPRATSTRSR